MLRGIRNSNGPHLRKPRTTGPDPTLAVSVAAAASGQGGPGHKIGRSRDVQ